MGGVRGWAVPAAVLGTLLLAGCADDRGEAMAGFGLGELSAEDAADVFVSAGVSPGAMTGRLVVEQNGCFTWAGAEAGSAAGSDVSGAWIVWPESAERDPERGDGVVLDGEERVGDGADLEGTGALVALEDLPGGTNADSYFASFGAYCAADAHGVIVLTAVSSR